MSSDRRADVTLSTNEDPLSYWRGLLSAGLPVVELPTDTPRTARIAAVSAYAERTAAPVGRAALEAFAHGVPAEAVLAAAFCVLLGRLCGEDAIAFGMQGDETGAASPAPLSVLLDTSAPLSGLLPSLHGQMQAAREHERRAAGAWREALPDARLSVSFAAGPGAHVAATPAAPGIELAVAATLEGDALRLHAGYDAALFEARTVARWLEAFETVLDAALRAPGTAIDHLPITSPAELAALHALQPAPTPRDPRLRVTDLVAAQALATPRRIALRHDAAAWDYAHLRARSLQIAHALRARGIGRGALVGLCLDRTPDMLCAVLGVLEAGAAYVPLDPAYPRDRLDYMAQDADLALLLAQAETCTLLDWPAERTLLLDRDLPADGIVRESLPDDALAATPESPAYVIYTSGSTGRPKGVVVPHRAAVNFLLSMRHTPGMDADDRLVAVTTLSFDIAVLELFLPLCTGAEIILASREQAMDGQALAALLRTHRATFMQATPASWRMLLETGWRPPAGFKSLCGGEALPSDLIRPLCGDGASLWNMYGPTETTVWSTCQRIAGNDAYTSIGTPIDNTTVWILDTALQPCPVGVPGEIWIGGEGVTLGYLHREELTRERFIADPMAPSGLLYRTGDRGRWRNDGRLEHLGRLDFQVKVRGYRIELGEIETSLADCDGVERAVVVTREDRPGDVRIVAYLTPTPGAAPTAATLRQQLRTRLPDYMVPQHFVELQSFPLLPNGKIDRKSLPAPGEAAAARAPAVAPRNEAERRILALASAVLSKQDIGIHDDFFALGGHSLLAARWLEAVRRELSVDLPLRTVFDAPTVAGLAAAAAAAGQAAPAPLPVRRAQPGQPAPLSLMQERLWVYGQLHPDSVAYNIPVALRLRGELDEAALGRAFAGVVERQSVLRTRLLQTEEGPVQVVSPADAQAFALPAAEDASALAGDGDALQRRLDALASAPIDLTQAPPFHARLLRLGPQDHVLFFMPHHTVWDGGSTDLFCAEMAAAYAGARAAHEPAPPPELDYADYAAWSRQALAGDAHRAHVRERLDYWRQRLHAQGLPAPLPTDLPREPGAQRRARMALMPVDAAVAEGLRQAGRQHGGTLYVVLLTAFEVLLHGYSGQPRVLVSSPTRFVDAPQASPLMGMFTGAVPVMLDIAPGDGFDALLAQARAQVIDGIASPHVQLDDLLRDPALRAHARPGSPFHAQFSYEDVHDRPQRWDGLQVDAMPLLAQEVAEDLMIWFFDGPAGLSAQLLYDATLFEPATIARLLDQYAALLRNIAADASASVAGLLGEAAVAKADNAAGNARDDASASAAAARPRAGDAPRALTPAEALIAGIWSELLQVDDIGPDDSFLDLGGHSLLAMTMISRVEKRSGVRLNLLKVANSTLRVLALELPQEDAPRAARPATLGARLRRLFGRDGTSEGS